MGSLGKAHHSLKDYPRAIDLQQQSLEIARAIGDQQGEAKVWFSLGLAQERTDQAVQCIQQARVLYSSMALDTMVQRCDEVLNRLSTPRRGWLRRLVGWLLRVVHRLWGRMRRRERV